MSQHSVTRATSHIQQAPPPLRLQVWYYSTHGQSSRLNRGLAHDISNAGLGSWIAGPVIPASGGGSARDRYVPIEVDFEYNPSSGPTTPDESVRELFGETLPPLIENFFKKINQKPHHVTLYPIGEAISKTGKQLYTHVRIERSLAMDYERIAQSALLKETPLQYTAGLVIDALPGSALLAAKLYGDVDDLKRGKPLQEVCSVIEGRLSDPRLPDHIPERGCSRRRELALGAAPEIKASWAKLAVCAASFLELAGDLQECAVQLSEGAAISNHDLYHMISQTAVAMRFFSVFQAEMETLQKLILDRYEHDSSPHLLHWGGALAVFLCTAIVFATGVGGAAAAIAAGTTAAGTGVYGGSRVLELWKRGKKNGNISDLDDMVPSLGDAMGKAQVALSAIFCSQVLKLPLDLMPRAEQKEILSELGVDVTELHSEDYREELLIDRIQRFATLNKQFEEKRKKVGLDVGLRDAKTATSKTLS